jgi:prepilin peptidase CpaA
VSTTHVYLVYGSMLLITLIASVTDVRSGLIPNWLTFPSLLLGPCIEAAYGGMRGLAFSVLGIVIAGGIPLLFHRMGGMGGGDVKLFAALGGLGGPRLGLEIELLALSCAFCWGIAKLTYRGHLLSSLGTSFQLFANIFRTEKHKQVVPEEELTYLRIGSAIFAGTLLAVVNRVLLGSLLS